MSGGRAAPEYLLAPAAVGLAAAYAAWELFAKGMGVTGEVASNIATPALSLAAMAFAWRAAAAVTDPAVARPWRLLAVAIGFMAAGDVIWAVGQSVFGIEPEVGWHDVPYLISYPLLLRALLAFPPRFRTRTEHVKFWLDALTVLVGGAMLVWWFIIYPVASRSATDPLARVVALAYIAGDLVLLLGVVAVLLRRPPPALRLPVRLLVLGLLLQFAGDLALVHAGLQEEYVTGGLTDVLWVLSYAFLLLAAVAQVRSAQRHALLDDAHVLRMRWLPYVAVAAGYGLLLFVGGQQESPAVTGLIVCAIVLTALVLARQVLALRENRRMAAQLAERRSEERFRALVQNSSDAVTIADATGRVLWQSPSAERILGAGASDGVGSPFAALAHAEDAPRLAAFVAFAAGSVQQRPLEWRTAARGGPSRHLESVATNLLSDPAVSGIVINTRDVTDRKELELKLGHALKMEAVGRLAGGVAHDFNNLLTAIRGHTALLLEHPESVSLRDDLEEIDRAAGRAAALTTQLLAFSRRQVLQPRIIDPNAAIRDVQRMLRRLIREDIDLRVELDDRIGSIRADPTQFEQVLLNLAVNAGDAMPRGGTLTIRTAACSDEDGAPYLCLSVSDTGTGMDSATLQRLFEPFFTTKAHGEGTGLGLATVYGIVQQSGGTIEVQSVPGAGSTFHVRLPCTDAAPRDGARAVGALEPASGSETILLVEDEAAVRSLARRTLERHGYVILEAADGVEALERAAAHDGPIHLLLTDVIMPRLGGPQLADRLAAARPGLRVLLMSGYTGETALLHGADGRDAAFLQKPFTPRELAARVRQVLDAGRSEGTLSRT